MQRNSVFDWMSHIVKFETMLCFFRAMRAVKQGVGEETTSVTKLQYPD